MASRSVWLPSMTIRSGRPCRLWICFAFVRAVGSLFCPSFELGGADGGKRRVAQDGFAKRNTRWGSRREPGNGTLGAPTRETEADRLILKVSRKTRLLRHGHPPASSRALHFSQKSPAHRTTDTVDGPVRAESVYIRSVRSAPTTPPDTAASVECNPPPAPGS